MSFRRLRGRLVLVGILTIGTACASITFGSAASLPVGSDPLTAYRTCLLTATPSTTPAVSDSEAAQDSAGSNFGLAASLNVRSYNSSRNRRIYLKFDLTACQTPISSSATVKSATLRLFITVLPTACRTQDVFRVNGSWTETGVTWTNQPFGTAVNNPSSAQRTAAVTVGSGCEYPTTFTYVSWPVTPDVQAWISGAAQNNGWMIRDDAENSSQNRTVTYAAKNAGQVDRAPQLSITFTS